MRAVFLEWRRSFGNIGVGGSNQVPTMCRRARPLLAARTAGCSTDKPTDFHKPAYRIALSARSGRMLESCWESGWTCD